MPSPHGDAPGSLEKSTSELIDPSNPFVHKLHLGAVQKLKICVLGLFLLPLRIVIILISLTLATAIARIGLVGISDEQLAATPFTGWRLYIRHAIWVILRVMFAFCGFWPVKVIGKQAPSEAAPILCVAPHSTFFDALAVAVMGAPSVVAKAETKNVPFFGSLIRYTQPLLVHRTDPDSRKKTLDTMKERSVEGKGWQQVLIFPEGTCTNRSALITFRLGAFIPGVPVQPVIIRYDNCYDTVTWTWEGIPAWKAIVFSLSQFRINHSVEFLPPYSPSEEEVAKPQLFDLKLGEERISEATMRRLAETFLHLPPKEVGEIVAAASADDEILLSKLKEFIPEKRPSYIKAIRKWEKGLVDTHSDLLALASFTAAAEKANQIMAAGKDVVSDVSATMAASRDKMTGVLSSAVTSLHRRTGSGRVVIDKKAE